MLRKIRPLALAAGLLTLASPALATPLYGGNTYPRLTSVDQGTGAMTSIATTTYDITGLAWDFDNDVMYGGNNNNRFFSIDLGTGAQTLIDGSTTYVINDLVFGPGNVLYGSNDSMGRFFSIDPGTGAMTLISQNAADAITGLAYDRDTGILYGAGILGGYGTGLFTINPSNGAKTWVGSTSAALYAISIDPATGQMYGQFNQAIGNDRFYMVNKATGALTLVNSNTTYEANALSFVPEPGTLLLLGAGLFGLAVQSRRRS